MNDEFYSIFPNFLAIWIGGLSIWSFWRQSQVVLEYGIGVSVHVQHTLLVSFLLFILAIAFVYTFAKDSRLAPPLFGLLAISVMTPPIFAGSGRQLVVLRYDYYSGFDWIASEWIQWVWFALGFISIFCIIQIRINRRIIQDLQSSTLSVKRSVRFEAIYWILTAWFTILALNPTSELISRVLWTVVSSRELNANQTLFKIGSLAMPIGIALALWLRSGAAVWLVVVSMLSSYGIVRFFSWDSYWPEHGFFSPYTPKGFYLSHPLFQLLVLILLAAVVRAKIIRLR